MELENAIEIRNMTKSFKTYKDKPHSMKEWIIRKNKGPAQCRTVLDDISLNIKKGESVALLGTNGSGKSTLLKIMTKILYPNQGSVKTQGRLASLLELGAGFHPDFTGRENIYFNAAIFGMTKEQTDAKLQEIIDFSELGSFIDEPVRTYSSGMYMRLAFSVAINVDADILLIDEILAVGDQHFQNKCYEKLEQLRDSDKTIVIVSHSLDSIKGLCTRAVWIYNTHVQLDGDPAYVIRQYLAQVAKDNHEEAVRRSQGHKSAHASGKLFVDTPAGFCTVKAGESLRCAGWAVSGSLDESLRVFYDGNPVQDVARVSRPDVFDVYCEEYAGLLDANTLGWEFMIPARDEPGQCMLEIQLLDKEQVIDRRKVQVQVL